MFLFFSKWNFEWFPDSDQGCSLDILVIISVFWKLKLKYFQNLEIYQQKKAYFLNIYQVLGRHIYPATRIWTRIRPNSLDFMGCESSTMDSICMRLQNRVNKNQMLWNLEKARHWQPALN